jgi:hypothetical protein
MTNIFEETYTAMEAAKKAYAKATTDEGRNKAEAAYDKAKDRMAEKGDIAWNIWRAYEHSRENENEILNFDDIIWDRDVEALTACMRERNQNLHLLLPGNGCGRNTLAFQRGRLHDRRDGRGQPPERPLGQGLRKGTCFQNEPELKNNRGREPCKGPLPRTNTHNFFHRSLSHICAGSPCFLSGGE